MKYYLTPDSALHLALYSAPYSKNIKRIVYQYLSEQLLTTKVFLHRATYTPPLLQKNCVLHRRCFQKHLHFTTFLRVFAMDQVCSISNKHQPLNNLAKYQYFYTRDFISFRYFENKNWRSPSQTCFQKSTFYHIFTVFKSE